MQDWKFFATMCDMGANGIKTLNLLDVSEKTPFYTFQNREIAALCAPPYLFKFTQSLSQKHNVANENKNKGKISQNTTVLLDVNETACFGLLDHHQVAKFYETKYCCVWRM